ncbi:DUF4160 domain-containing protein [Methylosinus sp. R-45379]|uniref:DUF4160 domain-containing protein n=1 Tax=Methylosinus sp. R-45379 TaxID=980563 RepID=UPI000A4A0764|nr:DUF4160 domain-containing protein [Methylosinus sp. R-45379]
MPTLKQFGSVYIRMYADDHSPPHFHIVSTTFEVLIALDGLEVIAGRAKPAQIAEALEWAQRNGDALAIEWARLNERG